MSRDGLRVVLLRPPRCVWPFNSETSAFWQPLGLLCLAAMARREMPDCQVEVWDAPGGRWGWRTLERRIADRPIDVLGVGEETVSAHEALRAAERVKSRHPDCLVVAGGTYFAHAIEEALNGTPIDVIVRGEGEATLVELLRRAREPDTWGQAPGLAFRGADGGIVRTPPRPLIADLDALPFPAYDLIDMDRYGKGSRNHPGLVSIEHGRGCVDRCAFCILWKHMGQSVNGNGEFRPRYRTQSAGRSFETVSRLYHRYERRTFGWVDPTFNASPDWSDAWAERMLGSEMMDARGRAKTLHTAWMRADCVLRDEKLGVLAKLVRAGLRQVMIGVERDDDAGLAALGKRNNSREICREAFAIFREKYPRVFTIGTVIFGLPGDTREDLRRLEALQYNMGMDFCFVMPLTPNPGTAVADRARRDGSVANPDLAAYNFHTPVLRTEALSLRNLESVYWRILTTPRRGRARCILRDLLLQRDPRKHRVQRALLGKAFTIAAKSLGRALLRPKSRQPTVYARRPSWYDK